MKIYIAGKISGNPWYKKEFARAEQTLRGKGHSVMNPARLGFYDEFSWEDYMIASGAMQRICEAVLFLPNWKDSDGAKIERERAFLLNQKQFFRLEDIPQKAEKISGTKEELCRLVVSPTGIITYKKSHYWSLASAVHKEQIVFVKEQPDSQKLLLFRNRYCIGTAEKVTIT